MKKIKRRYNGNFSSFMGTGGNHGGAIRNVCFSLAILVDVSCKQED